MTCSPKAKWAKIDASEKHLYPPLTGDAEDEVAHSRNIEALKEHMSKTKVNYEAICELMRRTLLRRRSAITDNPNPSSVQEITEEYPVLKRASLVSFPLYLQIYKYVYILLLHYFLY